MVRANIIFENCNTLVAQLSTDIFDELFQTNNKLTPIESVNYIQVHFPSYNKYERTNVFECISNQNLPPNSIKLYSSVFRINMNYPTIDFCDIIKIPYVPPVLDTVIIAFNSRLYDSLTSLRNKQDQQKFIQIKYGIHDKVTVVHSGQTLCDSWCQIIDCSPYYQGTIDFSVTKVIFIKDKAGNLLNPNEDMLEVNDLLELKHSNSITLKLRGLESPVNFELLKPKPNLDDDDSIFVFTDAYSLSRLGITSGSYVKIFSGEISRIAKIFVFLKPNSFKPGSIYATPRMISNFVNIFQVTVEKYPFNPRNVPTASNITVSRVGSWENSQKIYQNIILQRLMTFLTEKKRLLNINDYIPVTFDSNMALLYDDLMYNLDLGTRSDALVWFKINKAEFENDNTNIEFFIDKKMTKVVTTSIVSFPLMNLKVCDYISYYNLSPVFYYDLDVFPYAKRLNNIFEANQKCYSININLATSILLYSTKPNTGKTTLVRSLAANLGMHYINIDCFLLQSNYHSSDSVANNIGYIRAKIENLLPYVSPAVVYLSHLDGIIEKEQSQGSNNSKMAILMATELSKIIDDYTCNYPGIIFIASTYEIDSIPEIIRSKFKFELEVPVPTEQQRSLIFSWYSSLTIINNNAQQLFCFGQDVNISKLVLQSAGLTPLDIQSIIYTAKANCYKKAVNLCEFYKIWSGGLIPITSDDLIDAIHNIRENISTSIGSPKIPNVTWDDVGGLDIIKDEIMDTIDLPLKHPELFASGMKKRSGILFYGPPGTGKTLLAKAIATNFSLNFFSVKGPELLNMYIGESEANVRRVFQQARDSKPCVIFFDELDSVAPKRGNQGDSGGVMDRIVSQLLAELDGMGNNGDGVFVIGATNRPDLLDEALLRPGRFDKMLYLGVSDTNEKQENILKALTRNFVLNEDVDISFLAKLCPFIYTGADFYALCSDAMLNAMTRAASKVDKKIVEYNKLNNTHHSICYWFNNIATENDTKLTVHMEDFLKAQKELVPSVSNDELEHYLRIKYNFESR